MDLNKLKTFYVLASIRSYTGCADKMCLTQSAVSHAIKKFEEDLGFKLIEKKSRVFKLTSKGEFLFERCGKIFNEIDQTLDSLMKGKGILTTIQMGAPVEFGSSVLIKSMGIFFKRHPDINVDFILNPNLLGLLLMDELDIIVDCIPHIHEDLVCVPLFREEYAVIASSQYITEKKIHQIKDLQHCNLLSFDKDLVWWKNFINALPKKEEFSYHRITQISNVRGIIHAAQESLGVGFVPRYTILKELEKGLLVELFPQTEVLNDHINIYLKERNFDKKPFKELISHIKSIQLH